MEYDNSIKTNWLFDNDEEPFNEYALRSRLDHCSAYPIKWRIYYYRLLEKRHEFTRLAEQNIDKSDFYKGAAFGFEAAYANFHELCREYCEGVVEDERKRYDARKVLRDKNKLNTSDDQEGDNR